MKTTTASTRLSAEALQAVRGQAARRGINVSTLLGQAIALLSVSAADPDNKLAAVAKLLGLEPDASADEIVEAIGALAEPAAATDPLAAAPEPPPVALTTLSRLSTSDRASLAKRGIATEAQFQAAKAAMPRSPSKKEAKK
ncbi:MAG: hypothetical protein WDO69_22735 [Pseudomonadota bacterium]